MRGVLGQLGCVLLTATLLCGCQREADPGMTRYTLEHDGLTREYFVFLPPQYDGQASLPALFFLHGYGGTATGTEAETTNGSNRYAARYGYIAVYPQGTWFRAPGDGQSIVTSWNDLGGNRDTGPEGPLCAPDATRYPCPPECGDCGRCGWTSCHDDVGFVAKLSDEVHRRFATASHRHYLAGFSNGATMSQRIACEHPERFAAVALIGGRLERGYQCAPGEALPMFQLGGGRDRTIPWEGVLPDSEYYYASAATVRDDWAAANGCDEPAQDWNHPIAVEQALACNARCAPGRAETISCLWPDGGHVWPGYPADHGSGGYCATDAQRPTMTGQALCVAPDTRTDVWGSRLMFGFFERHGGTG